MQRFASVLPSIQFPILSFSSFFPSSSSRVQQGSTAKIAPSPPQKNIDISGIVIQMKEKKDDELK